MAKPELGTKRLCSNCGAKFYDLNKDPIVCPKCETVFEPAVLSRSRPEPAAPAARPAARPAAPVEVEPVAAEANVELVSLEEADAEAQGKKPAAGEEVAEDDIEIDESLGEGEDDTFIEEEEEGDEDVTGIIGDVNGEEEV